MKKQALIFAALALVLIALGGAFLFGAFDGSPTETPNLADNQRHSTPNDQAPAKPATPHQAKESALRDVPELNHEVQTTFTLALDAGDVDATGLEIRFAESNAFGAEIKATLGEASMVDGFFSRKIELFYRGPSELFLESMVLPVEIHAEGREPAKSELLLPFTRDQRRILLRVNYSVSLSGAVFVQGGAKPYPLAKVRVTREEPNTVPAAEGWSVVNIFEEGVKMSRVLVCAEDGSFEGGNIAAGALKIEALYPDGSGADHYFDMIQTNTSGGMLQEVERVLSRHSEERGDPREKGRYVGTLHRELKGGETREGLWLGLTLVSNLYFQMVEQPKGPAEVRFFAEAVERDRALTEFYHEEERGVMLRADDKRWFTMSGLSEEVQRIRIRPKGYLERSFVVEVRPGEDINLGTLSFESGQSLRGRVHDEVGKGLSGVRVVVGVGPLAIAQLWAGSEKDPLGRSDPPYYSVLSGENGAYQIDGLPSGLTLVSIQHKTLQAAITRVELPPEVPIVVHDILAARSGSIKGTVPKFGDKQFRVSLLSTQVIAGSFIVLMTGDRKFGRRELAEAKVDDEGVFSFLDVAPGEYDLVGRSSDLQTRIARVTVAPGGECHVALEFPDMWNLSGQILGRDGQPWADADVWVSKGYGDGPMTKTDADGRYSVNGFAPGTYFVRLEGEYAWMEPAWVKRRSILLEEGKEHEFNIDLSKSYGSYFYGKITVNGQNIFQEARLTTGEGGSASMRTIIFGEGGRIEIPDVAAGKYYLGLEGDVDDDNGHSTDIITRMILTATIVGERIDISKDFKAGPVRGAVTLPPGVDPTRGKIRFFEISDDTLGADVVKRLSDKPEARLTENSTFSFGFLIEGRYRAELYHPDVARSIVEFTHDGVSSSLSMSALEKGYALKLQPKYSEGDLSDVRHVVVKLFGPGGEEVFPEDESFLGVSRIDTLVFAGLAKGRYRVVIDAGVVEAIDQYVDVGAKPETLHYLELRQAARIDLTISNPELSAIDLTLASLSWKNLKSGKSYSHISFVASLNQMKAPSKILSAKGLSAGEWEVTITLAGYQPFKASYKTRSGEVTTEEVFLIAK